MVHKKNTTNQKFLISNCNNIRSMTPMMEQYHEIKAKYPDAVLFYRLGDFYEMFFEDAVDASRLLQITLTSRSKGENKTPMCGIPYHAANAYIAKLTKLGKKVAICEQLSDPKEPGIVKRDVVRIITPGTTLDDAILEQKSNNFLLAISYLSLKKIPATRGEHDMQIVNSRLRGNDGAHEEESPRFGLAYADISTGEIRTTEVFSEKDLFTELERIRPTETIVKSELFEGDLLKRLSRAHVETFFFPQDFSTDGETFLKDFFHLHTLDGFGLQNMPQAVNASAMLLHYLQTTQKTDLKHIQGLQTYTLRDDMPLDEATLKNLELLTTLRENKKEGSLLWVLDQTITSMGGRKLRFTLTHPLLDRAQIEGRLDAIEELFENPQLLEDVREVLKQILDMERLLARLSLGHGNARDILGLKLSLQTVPYLQSILMALESAVLKDILNDLDALPDVVTMIEQAIVEEPPLSIREGGMIKDGFHEELDGLKKISREGKHFIQAIQKKEIERTGIHSLKVRFNQVFGYYIEISNTNLSSVPQDYIRKQTLVNAERFITPELKEYEEKILGAEEKIVALEYEIFTVLRESIIKEISRIQRLAQAIASLDVLCSLAKVAIENRYCKPSINATSRIDIHSGRHPVVERVTFSSQFIPNDTLLQNEERNILLITGPNMGGKSTYLRQVALIVLMAQIGSFVPAAKADIGIVDRIFTRVGASDNLVRGQSTFMVEMQETAYILNNATEKSLIILDEIGRGTSTYDGMSIAWAILEFLHDTLKAKTLFATHYHELIALAEKLPHAKNYSVAVKEDGKDGIVFLYKIVAGGVDRSYGIEVAKLAGLPQNVLVKARQILVDLEEGVMEQGISKELTDSRKRVAENQRALFEETRLPQSLKSNPQLDEISRIDLNAMTPMEALQKLHEVQKKLKE